MPSLRYTLCGFRRQTTSCTDASERSRTDHLNRLGRGLVRLVVTGSRAGEVWLDDRASRAGIYPLEPAPFIDWYLAWLAEAEGLATG